LLSADVSGIYLSENIRFWDEYQIVQCQGCKSISFRKNHRDTEDVDFQEQKDGSVETELNDNEEIYPNRIAGRQKLNRAWLLPIEVMKIYNETHIAICSKLSILSIIGIRTLIEAICKEKKSCGTNLKEKVDNLVKMRFLTPEGADILHALRDLGNESAHEIKSQNENTISIALEVVENLLQSVYILPRIAKNIKDSDEYF